MSSASIADATYKLMHAEMFDKNSLLYEESVFKVIMCTKFKVLSVLAFFCSKLVDEALEIIDRSPISTTESNQESCLEVLNESFISKLRARAHALRLSTWNGDAKRMSAIKYSCSELGKLNYIMNESEQHLFNNKLKKAFNQTMYDFSTMINDLKITDQ
ncbi:hypothetical protein I4U23_010505 [Adineta vaga]|nr:hypothetical protein I4U23_010505 [Adineta vaga]